MTKYNLVAQVLEYRNIYALIGIAENTENTEFTRKLSDAIRENGNPIIFTEHSTGVKVSSIIKNLRCSRVLSADIIPRKSDSITSFSLSIKLGGGDLCLINHSFCFRDIETARALYNELISPLVTSGFADRVCFQGDYFCDQQGPHDKLKALYDWVVKTKPDEAGQYAIDWREKAVADIMMELNGTDHKQNRLGSAAGRQASCLSCR